MVNLKSPEKIIMLFLVNRMAFRIWFEIACIFLIAKIVLSEVYIFTFCQNVFFFCQTFTTSNKLPFSRQN